MPRTAVLESPRRVTSQAVADVSDPLFRRHTIGPELLQPVLLLAGEEGAVATQLAGGGRVEQTAGVGRAHLEEHAHLNLAQLLVREVAVEVVHGVAPGDQVHAQAGTFTENHVEVVRRREVILFAAEAEVVLATAQVAEPGQVVNEQEELRSLAGVGLLAQGQLAGNGGEELRSVAPAANLDAVGQRCGEPAQNSRLRVIFGRAVEHVESCPRAGAGGGRGRVLGDEADDGRGGDAHGRLVVLADDQQVVAPLPAEESRGAVRCDHDRPPARRRREVFGAGVGAGFGSRGGDSVRTDWTKDGPAGPDAIGSPWALTGGGQWCGDGVAWNPSLTRFPT